MRERDAGVEVEPTYIIHVEPMPQGAPTSETDTSLLSVHHHHQTPFKLEHSHPSSHQQGNNRSTTEEINQNSYPAYKSIQDSLKGKYDDLSNYPYSTCPTCRQEFTLLDKKSQEIPRKTFKDCGHIYHLECIPKRFLIQDRICPSCDTNQSIKRLIPLDQESKNHGKSSFNHVIHSLEMEEEDSEDEERCRTFSGVQLLSL
ncbi:hypothetical protein PSTT_02769 [Puccinia striiformis]|uniref:RING-type domain-containing protein n=1 Tax=Puccinia striiformis TaxID=27350 RepID=A0A2S4VYM9_9BASI|nr:hypothetical protein PSTT_02769 [Puccinia striiformis]